MACFYDVTVFALRCFVCNHVEDNFYSNISLGVYEKLQIDYDGTSHLFVFPVFSLENLLLLADSY